MAHVITVKSALGDKLLFSRLAARESLGQLFGFELRLVSRDLQVGLRDLLGTAMAVHVKGDDGFERWFHGIVCEAAQTGFVDVKSERWAEYGVSLVPKPWLLTRKTDCRIFTTQTVPEIVKTLLAEVGYTDVKLSLSGTYPKRDYCVQYRETGFNFVSRLLEQEGIYYYFKHGENAHTMVLADALGAHAPGTGFEELPFVPVVGGQGVREAAVLEWRALRSVQTTHFALTDYDPLKPKASLLTPEVIGNLGEVHTVGGLESFDYPGAHHLAGDGARYAQVRLEALNVAQARFAGATTASGLTTGALFKLKEFPRPELNREYLVVGSAVQFTEPGYVSGGVKPEPFTCTFEAVDSRQPFRSAQTAVKPVIVGLQTAVVTGSTTAEDIVVDQYGRIQVVFHWNRPDKKNHKVSCPVRVASSWAGKNWGAIHIPRVGQEVVVSFLEGDPDRPLVIGSVYNADNMPPYPLPAEKTRSGIKSRSHEGGGAANFNEIRFEDKKGSEELLLHAEKDMTETVENDHVVSIGHDETETIKHDRKHLVENDETFTIKKNRTHDVGMEDKLTVGANSTTDVKQAFKLTAGTEIKLVTGASSITMKADGTIEIKGVNIKVNGSMIVAVEAGLNFKAKGGVSAEVAAGATMNLKSDGMLVVGGTAMTTMKGAMVTVKGDAMTTVGGGILMLG